MVSSQASRSLQGGAPWQIRITDELRARIVQQAPPEYLPMLETTMKLGVSRQTVLQRVKRGELQAVLVRQGRRKGLRIKVVDQPPALFLLGKLVRAADSHPRNPRAAGEGVRWICACFQGILRSVAYNQQLANGRLSLRLQFV